MKKDRDYKKDRQDTIRLFENTMKKIGTNYMV